MEEKKDVFERLKYGEAVSMFEEEFRAAISHMDVTRKMCFKINHTVPELDELRLDLSKIKILGDRYPAGSDFAKRAGK